MSSSSASSSSATPEPQPSPILKRKRKVEENLDSDADEVNSDASDSESDAEAAPSTLEEPVLSHAERRRQKKEAKSKTKLDASTSKKRKLKDGSAAAIPAPTKRQNSVWVGNMSFKTTQENLRTFFDGCGEITRINMPTKPPVGPGLLPENRGFAYVDFSTPEGKAAAIARSEQPLVGRKLLIKDGDDFAGRPLAPGVDVTTNDSALAQRTHSKTAQKILRAQKQPPAPTLFIGNLGFETTDFSIRELFEAHRIVPKKKGKEEPEGEADREKTKDVWIRKVRMGTFEDSGLCKGFAFVDFTSIDHATSVLINPKNHHLNGRDLVVQYAGADAVRRGAVKTKHVEGVTPKGRRPLSAGYKPKRPQAQGDLSSAAEKPTRKTREPNPVGDDSVSSKRRRDNPDEGQQSSRGEKDGVRHKGPRTRPKPGAALALAKRESAAIIPSQGQKITF